MPHPPATDTLLLRRVVVGIRLSSGGEVPIWGLRVPIFAGLTEGTGGYRERTICVYYADTKLSAKAYATTIIFGHSLEGMSVSIMVPISSSSTRSLLRP